MVSTPAVMLSKIDGDSLSRLSYEVREYLLYILLCMTLDVSITTEISLMFLLQEVLASLLDSDDSMPEDSLNEAFSLMFSKINDLSLRLQLVQSIPIHSSRLCSTRRRLARGFFFNNDIYISGVGQKEPDLSDIAQHLRTEPAFIIRGNMDFQQLGASMSLLDIVIDDGDPPRPLTEEAEKSFNKQVDEVLQAVRDMSSKIVDTGASHISRTETKEVLIALDTRLQYAVRTRPKPKRSVFGDIAPVGSKKVLQKWMKTEFSRDEQ